MRRLSPETRLILAVIAVFFAIGLAADFIAAVGPPAGH